jgi:hypothetical protein
MHNHNFNFTTMQQSCMVVHSLWQFYNQSTRNGDKERRQGTATRNGDKERRQGTATRNGVLKIPELKV